jgi:hypothetical protein
MKRGEAVVIPGASTQVARNESASFRGPRALRKFRLEPDRESLGAVAVRRALGEALEEGLGVDERGPVHQVGAGLGVRFERRRGGAEPVELIPHPARSRAATGA